MYDLTSKQRLLKFQQRLKELFERFQSAEESIMEMDRFRLMLVERGCDQEDTIAEVTNLHQTAIIALEAAKAEIMDNCTGLVYKPKGDLASAIFSHSTEDPFVLAACKDLTSSPAVLYTKIDHRGDFHSEFIRSDYQCDYPSPPETAAIAGEDFMIDLQQAYLEQFSTAMSAFEAVFHECKSMSSHPDLTSHARSALAARCPDVSEAILTIVANTLVTVVSGNRTVQKRARPAAGNKRRKQSAEVVVQIPADSSSDSADSSPRASCASSDLTDFNPALALVVPKAQSLELFSCDIEKWFEVNLKGKITVRGATAFFLSATFDWFVYSQIEIKKVRLYDGGVEKKRLTAGKQYPGMIADETTLFVFGGECSRTCEKFTVETMLAEPIASMLAEHSHFQPCFSRHSIFICGGRSTSCEEYRPESDSFHDLSLLIPFSTSSYATVFDDYLHIIGNSQRCDVLTYYWKSRVDNGDEIHVKSKIADETWGTDVRIVGDNAYFLVSEMVFRLNLSNTEEESVLMPSLYPV